MKPIITKFNTSTGDVEIMIPVPCRDPWESHINHPMSAYEENERYNIFYLIKENQELKKQLNSDDWINSIKETERHYIYSIENENEKLKKRLETKETQQKEFIEYLEKEIVDSRAGSGQQYYAQNHLRLYKEIIGE